MKLLHDLREFVASLNSHRVDFIVVGAHAVAFHGYPRFTGDLDLLVRPTENNASRLMSVLQDFGFGSAGLSAEELTKPGIVVQLGSPPNRIDIMTSISGVDFEAAWLGRQPGELDGVTVFFLGFTELLINKKAAGRAKDLADLEALGGAGD